MPFYPLLSFIAFLIDTFLIVTIGYLLYRRPKLLKLRETKHDDVTSFKFDDVHAGWHGVIALIFFIVLITFLGTVSIGFIYEDVRICLEVRGTWIYMFIIGLALYSETFWYCWCLCDEVKLRQSLYYMKTTYTQFDYDAFYNTYKKNGISMFPITSFEGTLKQKISNKTESESEEYITTEVLGLYLKHFEQKTLYDRDDRIIRNAWADDRDRKKCFDVERSMNK